jgi:hypothetical protein
MFGDFLEYQYYDSSLQKLGVFQSRPDKFLANFLVEQFLKSYFYGDTLGEEGKCCYLVIGRPVQSKIFNRSIR